MSDTRRQNAFVKFIRSFENPYRSMSEATLTRKYQMDPNDMSQELINLIEAFNKTYVAPAPVDKCRNPCNYNADCRNPHCKFWHPGQPYKLLTLCMFGNSCRDPYSCRFRHSSNGGAKLELEGASDETDERDEIADERDEIADEMDEITAAMYKLSEENYKQAVVQEEVLTGHEGEESDDEFDDDYDQ